MQRKHNNETFRNETLNYIQHWSFASPRQVYFFSEKVVKCSCDKVRKNSLKTFQSTAQWFQFEREQCLKTTHRKVLSITRARLSRFQIMVWNLNLITNFLKRKIFRKIWNQAGSKSGTWCQWYGVTFPTTGRWVGTGNQCWWITFRCKII